MKNVVILLTRLPIQGETKSRLRDFLTAEAIQHVSQYLLTKNYQQVAALPVDIRFSITAQTPGKSLADFLAYDPARTTIEWQEGADLGERMAQSMQAAKQAGYKKIILIGTDLYDLTTAQLKAAFAALDNHDVVLAPTFDGGYGLIGWQNPAPELFALDSYGGQTVYHEVKAKAEQAGLTLYELPMIHDVDIKEDIARILTQDDTATFLAQGEYNANFRFANGKRLLRIALGSQMHLENQIAYEYGALQLLKASGVTPTPRQLVREDPLLGAGYLVEDYLPGRPLQYEQDWEIAATLLSKVHQVPIPAAHGLRLAEQPLALMMQECQMMFQHYRDWAGQDPAITQRIEALLARASALPLQQPLAHPCLINTELNSTNFLINHDATDSYIIDWEKPLLGEREQDIAHFLAPTTTRWRTDYVFDQATQAAFVAAYNAHSPIAIAPYKLVQYLVFTCLRGLTWCAMADVEYHQQTKLATNAATARVIREYLSVDFLTQIEARFEQWLTADQTEK